MPEPTILKTVDGIEISALVNNISTEKAAILLHMMPATKESWLSTMETLSTFGYGSIAIDERGHGDSTMGGTLDHTLFSDEEQQSKIHDVIAANAYLLSIGIKQENIVVIGASIGANLAVQFLSMIPEIKTAIALSPGLNYHSVMLEEAISKLSEGQHVVAVASNEDSYSYSSVQTIFEKHPDKTKVFLKTDLGHGTIIFDRDPSFMREILSLLP